MKRHILLSTSISFSMSEVGHSFIVFMGFLNFFSCELSSHIRGQISIGLWGFYLIGKGSCFHVQVTLGLPGCVTDILSWFVMCL